MTRLASLISAASLALGGIVLLWAEHESGELTPVRLKILAELDRLLPASWPDAKFREIAPMYDPAHLPMPNYTTCGELPRHVGSLVGINTRGALAGIRDMKGWTPYTTGARPKPGDFLLFGDGKGGVGHIDVAVDTRGSTWRTADAGQGPHEKQGAAFVDRVWDEDKGTLGGVNGPRPLLGWLDVDQAAA